MKLTAKQIETLVTMDGFLSWRVELSAGDALEVALAMEKAASVAPHLSGLIRDINASIPTMQYGPTNGNTGKMHHTFLYGRELSRVLYVRVILSYLPNLMDAVHIEQRLAALAKTARADEYSVKRSSTSKTFRYWWD